MLFPLSHRVVFGLCLGAGHEDDEPSHWRASWHSVPSKHLVSFSSNLHVSLEQQAPMIECRGFNRQSKEQRSYPVL